VKLSSPLFQEKKKKKKERKKESGSCMIFLVRVLCLGDKLEDSKLEIPV
jgi:hypothetical protein